mmetsp:Transcript_47878/g.138482  ORF Transcript_47878/g.138482 Transcript_47878/m.138482 type:complete len:217 (+) Transcript_47878:494-1144(+)
MDEVVEGRHPPVVVLLLGLAPRLRPTAPVRPRAARRALPGRGPAIRSLAQRLLPVRLRLGPVLLLLIRLFCLQLKGPDLLRESHFLHLNSLLAGDLWLRCLLIIVGGSTLGVGICTMLLSICILGGDLCMVRLRKVLLLLHRRFGHCGRGGLHEGLSCLSGCLLCHEPCHALADRRRLQLGLLSRRRPRRRLAGRLHQRSRTLLLHLLCHRLLLLW